MRRGHHRPLGTVTAPQRFSWNGSEPPQLGDVALQTSHAGGDPDELERAFLVVGIEETRSTAYPYRLVFERIAYDPAMWPFPARREWCFHNVPRGQR